MELPFALQLSLAAGSACALFGLLWLVQRTTRNAGIVDLGWTFAVGALGIFFAMTSTGLPERRYLVAAMIGLWSLRLGIYLTRRVVGHPEEGRYATLREHWGDAADRNLLFFFQMQAAAALFFAALPWLVASNSRPGLDAWDWSGLALWLAGVGGVALADWQLEQFRGEPANRGRTCRAGLWRYSRHPNYFFEWLHWTAYLPLAHGAEYWWLAPLVPLVLLYFLFFVTGIPPTEAQAVASRGEDYRQYQRSTSVFVPWWPSEET